MANFDVELNDEVENFTVEFGEVQRITVDDFDKLRNRPSYAGQTMTHETNIPEVPSKVSQLENDANYQTDEDVQEVIAGKQDKLTAGNNIQISEQNVISATNTTYSAGNGINISGENAISVDTTVVATQQNLSDEVTNRENADIYLQGQIDAISASSDVVDIVGTYAELQAYDTQHLKDNDIIKVLQDETQGDATTYYRWSTHTQTFTLIGQEGPYYTKAGADAQFVPQTRTVNSKALSANITLTASDVGALGSSDVVQTTGTSTSQVMSQNAVTNELNNKLNISDYVVDDHLANSTNPVQNQVLNGLLGNMSSDFFSGSATTTPTASTDVQFGNILNLDDVQLLGNTTQETTTGKNILPILDGTISYGGLTVTSSNGIITINGTTTSGLCIKLTNGFAYINSSAIDNSWLDEKITTNLNGKVLSIKLLSGTAPGSGTAFRIYGDTTSFITQSYPNLSRSLPFTDDNSATCFVIFSNSGYTFDNATYELQLENGSTGTSWEKYTGGIPAPNPDYPETINVVTGVQNVLVHGKNLFNVGATLENRYLNTDGGWTAGAYSFVNQEYNVGNNTALTVSFTSRVGSSYVRVGMYKADGSFIERVLVSTNSTVNLSAGTSKIVTSVDNASGAKFNDLQIEFGSSASSYESYQSQTYTIDLGATELCKIGDYQDYIYKSGDDWYVHKATNKFTVTSSLSLGKSGTSGNNAYYYSAGFQDIDKTNMGSGSGSTSVTPSFSTYFGAISARDIFNSGAIGMAFDKGAGDIVDFRVGFGVNSAVNTLDLFKTWLDANELKVYYPLATPTDTQITDATLISELEALLSASTYDGETDFVITATGTNLPAPLQLTAVNANAKGIIERLRA